MKNPSEIIAQKSFVRLELQNKLLSLASSVRQAKGRRIVKKILKKKFFHQAQSVMIYVSTPEEVDSRELLTAALKLGKEVCVPVIEKKTKVMKVCRIFDMKKDLKEGPYGILQPSLKKLKSYSPEKLDLILVPGLGFDRAGRRLGRGAGYFDRFLSKAPKALKIGVAFREQIKRRIPVLKHDILMDQIITD